MLLALLTATDLSVILPMFETCVSRKLITAMTGALVIRTKKGWRLTAATRSSRKCVQPLPRIILCFITSAIKRGKLPINASLLLPK